MAKANPVTQAPEKAEEPAKADVRQMEPAAALVSKKAGRSGPAPVDPKELEALVAEHSKNGKAARVVGNAVRVDH